MNRREWEMLSVKLLTHKNRARLNVINAFAIDKTTKNQ